MKSYYFLLFILLFSCSKEKQNISNCSDINSAFKTYTEANNTIESIEFNFVDDIDTSSSSWIRSANYYSCDGETGYLVYTTDNKKYIHENVPLDLWDDFKNADSFGNFYNENIKNKYRLVPDSK